VTTSVIGGDPGWLVRLRDRIPERYRESFYRAASAVTVLLLALGATTADRAFLWGQLAVATVSSMFAILYTTSYWRVALYTLVGPLGGLLMTYGLVTETRWALVVTAVGQVFGITTSAAKAVHPAGQTYALFDQRKTTTTTEN
jgi:hypothetical protein